MEPQSPKKPPLDETQIQALLDMAAMQSAAAQPRKSPYKALIIISSVVVVLVAVCYVVVSWAAHHY
jgi:hypothetical protein